MLAREDFASELFGSQHRVTGITGDLTGGVLRALQSCSPHLRSPPASFHLHSPWQRAGVLLVVYSTAQRCSALPRNSSSEQERPVRSAVLIWSSSAGYTPQRPWPLRRTPTAWNDRARAQCSQYPGSAHLTAEYRPPMQAYGAARSEFDRAAP